MDSNPDSIIYILSAALPIYIIRIRYLRNWIIKVGNTNSLAIKN